MSIISGGERHCKMIHVENGRVTVRRVHHVTVQATDGRVYTLTGEKLPDAISITSGLPHEGARAEIILGIPRLPSLIALFLPLFEGRRTRDLAFLFLGMFVMTGISLVADAIAQMLHV